MKTPITTLTFPPFRLDLANVCLWRGANRIVLPPKDFAVLRYLVTHTGQLVTHANLLQAVWPDAIVSPKGLKAFVRRLRHVLHDRADRPRFIETVHGQGYRFIGEVVSSQHPVVSREKENQKAKGKNQKPVLSVVEGAKVEFLTPAPSPQHPAPALVGREIELAQLHSWLAKAQNGERQLIFVTGEPGIGKTTLIDAFRRRLETGDWRLAPSPPASSLKPLASPVSFAHGQCVEQYGAGEPYMPVLEALGRLARTPNEEQLKTVLGRYAPTWLAQLPGLLSAAELQALQQRVLGATRERMLREIAEALEVLTAERTLVLVVEDLHWADVSTLELLALLARRREHARLLVVGTYRPLEVLGNGHPLNGVIHELHAHGLCEELALPLLGEEDVARYLQERFPHSMFPTRLAEVLHRRTEGNPLFIVSAIDDLVKQGVMLQVGEDWVLQGEVERLGTEVPESVRHLVARQRERLQPEEQQVLEAASVAGMEFSVAALAAALEAEVVAVGERCARLGERQQFLRPAGVAEWPDGTVAARYGFTHALYQHLWSERMSIEKQQQWHLRVGERKEAAYGSRASEIAPELAVHFEQGRDYPKAIRYLQHAADNALRRSAAREAIEQVSKGLRLLSALPKTSARGQQELTLQMTLSGALRMSKGFAAPEVADAYERARGLCRQVKATPQLFSVLWGLSSFYVARADVQAAREIGEQLLSLAGRMQDSSLLIEANMRFGLPLYMQGELVHALGYLEQGLKLYDVQQHRALAFRYGQDPGVMGFGYAALVLWSLGYPEQAQEKIAAGLRLAQEFGHPNTLAYAWYIAAAHGVLRREESTTQKYADALMTLATEREFPHWLTRGAVYRGWALAAQGHLDKGMSEMREGITASRKMGAETWQPYFRVLLAELYTKKGQPETGLALVTEALSMMDKTRERIAESELYRLKGELLLVQEGKEESQNSKGKSQKSKVLSSPQPLTPSPQAEVRKAEACFLKAIAIARHQQAKSFELRAVMSLVRLRQHHAQGHATRDTQHGSRPMLVEAHKMLSDLYGWFTEGFDTKDLQEAKTLLESL